MKRFLILLFTAPTLLFSQNITNTLGTNGTYIVEDENNSSLIRASRNGSTRMFFGDYDPAWTLPIGDIDFIHNEGSEKVNIVVGRGTAFSAIPKLQFYYTPGPLSAPTDVSAGSNLGIINFGGYQTSGGWKIAASINGEVDGALGTTIPGRISFSTTSANGSVSAMTFNSTGELEIDPTGVDNDLLFDTNGNLAVPGFSTATDVSLSNSITLSLNQYTLICEATGATAVTLPQVTADLEGKIYVIKRAPIAGVGNDVTITPSNSQQIEGNANIVLDTDWEYVVLQAIHQGAAPTVNTWVIIGGNYTP